MSPSSIRVMVVDDQKPFREAAQLVVELTEGFEVVGEAGTGEESVDMAARLAPDLVLMDVNLPGIDGLEATRRILGAAERPPVVVVLSTYEAGEYAAQARTAGAAAFIPKSAFDPDTLTDAWDLAAHSPHPA